ncbi:MAG TPA: 16S rRNA (guanine(966)-N(2))-methyltransferase RsmD [Bacilli bacterium]|nr:16S rRNA (guanine(966)-N(2))-methyltransferase RsmD [Bacilli bacterium]
MKIISGIYKGKNIELPDKSITRPTMNRIKESLFATINDYLKNAVVLDLFGGSGALAFEALSNGAAYAYIVDNTTINIIKKNIISLKVGNKCKLIKSDALLQLKIFEKENIKFDIIFLDPPYSETLLDKCLELISDINVLTKNGIIICEHNIKINNSNYSVIKEKKYGQKYITILNKNVD